MRIPWRSHIIINRLVDGQWGRTLMRSSSTRTMTRRVHGRKHTIPEAL